MIRQILNFRDLGGVKTSSGRYVTCNKIFRSGQLYNLLKEDQQALVETYHLQKIIDFRSEKEIEQAPDTLLPGVNYYNLDLLNQIEVQHTGFSELFQLNSKAELDDYMTQTYQEVVLHKAAQKTWGAFLEQLLTVKKGSVVFHCVAGKDRTGIAAALFLALLGVEPEMIMLDYLKTNTERELANQELLQVMRCQGFSSEKQQLTQALLTVKSKYLTRLFTTIEKQYGSIERYADQIGFDAEKQARLRQLYLE